MTNIFLNIRSWNTTEIIPKLYYSKNYRELFKNCRIYAEYKKPFCIFIFA